MVTDSMGRLVEKPQYGGTVSFVHTGPTWEPYSRDSLLASGDVIFQGLLVADPKKGPSGTGEYAEGAYIPITMKSGGIAESWEQPDPLTIIYHLRKGIRWGDSPLLNGRELVAADVVYSVGKVQDHPRSYVYRAPDTPRKTATALDKYTVEVKLPEPDPRGWLLFNAAIVITPPELEQAGLNWANWRTSVGTGTGPYILEEVVEGSSTFYKRNPNYWMDDPFHPDNRLPYPDAIQGLDIVDVSTQMAAMRTGKIDRLGVGWAQSPDLLRTNPELLYIGTAAGVYHVVFRSDSEFFGDKRVRQAMNMAVDNNAIVRDLYNGEATWLNYPYHDDHGPDIDTPFDEWPAEIQEIYTYNPVKARQLLADAGYPNGFKFEILAHPYQLILDTLAIYQVYFEDIGVEMTINQVEAGAFWSIAGTRAYEDANSSSWGLGDPFKDWGYLRFQNDFYNYTNSDDAFMQERYLALGTAADAAAQNKILKEIGWYILDNANFMTLPSPYGKWFWQPWLKSYNGDYRMGIAHAYSVSWLPYVWIDQNLKTEMGY